MATETINFRARNKFLLCFQPVAMSEPLKSDVQLCSGDQVFSYISVSDKGDSMIPTTLPPPPPPPSLPEKEQETSKVSKSSTHRPRKKVSRIFSALINAASFDTKLKRKLRNRKSRKDPSQLAKDGKLPYVIRFPKSSDFDDGNTDSSVSSSSLSSSSSSSSSSSAFLSRSSTSSSSSTDGKSFRGLNWEKSSLEVEKNDRSEPKQKAKKKTTSLGFYSSCYGLLLILISISIVIFSGRLYAILCTSTLFYLAPRPYRNSNFPEDMELKRPNYTDTAHRV